MLTLADIAKSYGTRTLFREVSLFLGRADRFGLVGPNGAGKSTLFRIILGEESLDEGTLTWERGADYGFLPQETAPAVPRPFSNSPWATLWRTTSTSPTITITTNGNPRPKRSSPASDSAIATSTSPPDYFPAVG